MLLGVARLDEYEGHAYSVGPMGVRVGFAFQQDRALNLVLALERKGLLSQSKKIAVVGGGLAGAMVKLALHGLGYGQARLFEATQAPMTVQKWASHRPIHPCYNNWPMVNWFESTTNFPFMNWHVGDASVVSTELIRKWNGYKRILVPVDTGTNVVSAILEPTGAAGAKVIRLFGPTEAYVLGEFDLVIFATGFGLEQDLTASSADSYWDDDRVGNFRDKTKTGRGLVSGIGDGGLMDFIRLCCVDRGDRKFLSIEIISLLRHQKYSQASMSNEGEVFEQSYWESRIRIIEETAAMMLPESAPAIAEIQEFGSPRENEIAEYLDKEYGSLVKQLPTEVSQLIDESVVDANRMFLIGRLAKPFSCATAPINKLIVAYILMKFPQCYIRGRLSIEDDKPMLIRFDGLGLPEPFSPEDMVIVRHGANPPVYRFSSAFRDRNRLLNRASANLTQVDRTNVRFCSHLLTVANDDPTSADFLKQRQVEAEQFAKAYLGVAPSVVGPFGKKGPRFEINPGHSDFSADLAKRRLGGVPRSLFGIPLVAVPPRKGSSAIRRR